MANLQHYAWATGHTLLLLSTVRYYLALLTFKSPSPWWYKSALIGAILSYGIVCHKSLGTPQPNAAYLRRALIDENVQYLLLAVFWWMSKPVKVALLPFAIFSLFHTLTFVRTTLMPHFLPNGPPATAGGPPQPHPMAKKLQVWVKSNYDKAMKVVAYAELIILVFVLLGAITFQNSLLTPLIFAHFLRQRHYQSAFTRDAVAHVTSIVDRWVRAPGKPPILVGIWEKCQMVVGRWAGTTLAPQQPPTAGNARAPRT